MAAVHPTGPKPSAVAAAFLALPFVRGHKVLIVGCPLVNTDA